MSTNYYLIHDERPPCPRCCRPYPNEHLHIGKSSAGWCFTLHYDEEHGLTSLDAWRSKWSEPGWRIQDEYGERITPERMMEIITKRYHPNGLRRHPIGQHCVAHGEGTWDMVPGHFS